MKEVLLALINLLWIALFAQVILSWLVVAGVRNDVVFRIYNALSNLTEPLIRPIRRVVPPLGGLDLSILLAFLILMLVRTAIVRNL